MNPHEIIRSEYVCEVPNAKLRIWLDDTFWSGFAVIYDPASGKNQVIYFSSETEESAKIQALKLASFGRSNAHHLPWLRQQDTRA